MYKRILKGLLFGILGYTSTMFGMSYRSSEQFILAQKRCLNGILESCLSDSDKVTLLVSWSPYNLYYLIVLLISFAILILLDDILKFVSLAYNKANQKR